MKKNGFTLIELLAVIIILGILMIIAIPSVTKYISDSRKSSYVDSVKGMINGATNLVNTGKLQMFDPNSTYYIPTSCIKSENGFTSPYGEFTESSYIVVTFDGKGYNYYYTGLDESGHGILLTNVDLLNEDSIITDLKSIDDKITIGERENVVIFKSPECDGTKEEYFPTQAILDNSSAELSLEVIDNVDSNLNINIWAGHISDRKKFEKISFIRGNTIPTNAIDSWDVSLEKDGRIMAWYTDTDNNGLYELTVGGKKKIYANPNCRHLFNAFTSVKIIDLQNFDTSKVTDMYSMFSGNGTSADRDMDLEYIYGLDKFDTSNVTNMANMFWYCSNLKELNLSHFNTSKVTDMSNMFSGWYDGNGALTKIDASNFDLSSVTNMHNMFSWSNKIKEVYLGKNNATKVTNLKNMFMYSRSLEKIDLSKINFNSSQDDTNMFELVKKTNIIIYVNSTANRDYILNSTTNNHSADWTSTNFVIK